MSEKTSFRKRAPRVVADVTRGEIVGVVEIAAPPERVFHALTDPAEVQTWWGSPELYRVTRWTADVRAGGAWKSEGVSVDGEPFSVEGEFVEVDPPRLLVQTWRPAWDSFHTTTIRYHLDPIPGGTRLTLRHDGFADRTASCDDHAEGWERVLGWLGAHLSPPGQSPQGAQQAPQVARFFCRLIPPRTTFPADMTAEEATHMAAHATYWRGVAADGPAVAFGPVGDPAGAWGLGVLEANDVAHAERLLAADPIILANLGFRYEKLPMFGLIARPGG